MAKGNGKAAETDLQFLLIRKKKPRLITDKKIRMLVRLARGYCSNQAIAKKTKISPFTICNLFRELRQAAKAGYTLEGYLKEGRPLKAGNEIIAK